MLVRLKKNKNIPIEKNEIAKANKTRRRRYFIKYWNNFSNTYHLCWTDKENEEKEMLDNGWKKITRKEAISNCVSERYRRKYDQACSRFADAYIYQYDHGDCPIDWGRIVDSYIVEF